MTKYIGSKVTVSCHYGMKLGRPNYSSEDTSMSIAMEFISETDDEGEMLVTIGKIEDALMSAIKVAVCVELGVQTKVHDAGVLVPDLPSGATQVPQVVPTPVAAIAPATAAPAASGGGDFGPPKATKEQIAVLPRINADFGKGMATYIDQRPLKAQGIYSPKSPDFKNATDSNDSHWLTGSNGNPNPPVVAGLTAAIAAAANPQEAPF